MKHSLLPLLILFLLTGSAGSANSNILNIKSNTNKLRKDTGSFFILSSLTAIVLYCLPENVSNWKKDDLKIIGQKWSKNVTEGPVWDKDDLFLNYVTHPYCGAAYHIVARNGGFNKTQAFIYSFCMSTFFWEYGIEAFAEKPSVQDLLVTPLTGVFVGEWFFQLQNNIMRNNNKVFGSKIFGRVCLFVLDPIGHVSSLLYKNYSRVDEQVVTNFITSKKLNLAMVKIKINF
jgi:hypothetical protein